MAWRCGKFCFELDSPLLMGILNCTPDSFSDGGRFLASDSAIEQAKRMIAEGAQIIDVGGESTRPGSTPVSPEDEWTRIENVVHTLAEQGICVSVDTRHAQTAKRAIDSGASLINDISGFRDPAMRKVAAESECGCIVVHMGGDSPQDMQDAAIYDDVVNEASEWLKARCRDLEQAGVAHDRICVDPGPGFGKDYRQTIELMRNIHEFVHLGYPVMAAPSRKSYVAQAYKIDDEDPKARDAASAAEALMACELGASVVRTHNVAETAVALAQLRPLVVLGLGSNVALVGADGEEREGKIAQLNHAVSQLCQLPDSQIIDIAPFYASEPAYYEDQDEFVNTVVLLRSGIPPRELLSYLQSIENSLGRVRGGDFPENGPRTLDIDIIDYQMYSFATSELTLPHPRATERDFVVKPLQDVAPGHVLADGKPIGCVPESERVGQARRI